jgi:hypothetical protein
MSDSDSSSSDESVRRVQPRPKILPRTIAHRPTEGIIKSESNTSTFHVTSSQEVDTFFRRTTHRFPNRDGK